MEDPFVDFAKKDYSIALGTLPVDFGVKEDWMANATDFAGNSRLSGTKPDAGMYEADQSQFAAGVKADVTSGLAPLTVTFTATVYGGTGEMTYYWDFNGDGVAEVTNKTTAATDVVQHEFTTAGAANVGLTVKNGNQAGATYTLPTPLTINALDKYIYVSKDSPSPASPYGSWAMAAHTVEEAVAAAVAGNEIVVSNGTHEIAAEIQILTKLKIVGFTGKPEDVILKAKSGTTHRMFQLAHADACVSSVTIRDGNAGANPGGGVFIGSQGGMLHNCVVHACKTTAAGCPGGGVYIATGATDGLVDSCVISNCYTYREGTDGGGTGLGLWGGVARNSLITENIEPSKCGSQNTAGSVIVSGGRLVNSVVTKNFSYSCPGVWAKSGWIVNCIIAENTSAVSTDGGYCSYAGTASCFSNCIAAAKINATCHELAHPFADSAKKDYSPVVGTVAIDGGLKEDWMEDAKDFLGNARVSGPKPDIGAIEYDQSQLVSGYAVDKASGKAPLSVTFTATPLGAQGALTYFWDLDGNGTYETETSSPTLSHTFTTPCAVAVGLKIVDSGVTPQTEAEAKQKTTIRAFGEGILVSKTSANPAEPYDTWANAAREVTDALAVAYDGCEIVVSNGTYDIATEHQILKGVTIRGLTGDWHDVALRSKPNSGSHRLFWLDHANARIQDVTVCGVSCAVNGGGVYIDTKGGTLFNCAITNCSSLGSYYTSGGGVYIASGATAALVDSCCFSACKSGYEGGHGGAAISQSAGMVRNCVITGCNLNNAGGNPQNCGSARVTGGTFAHNIVVGNQSKACPGVWATGGEVINCIVGDNTTQKPTSYNTCWVGTESCFKNCIMDIEMPLPASCLLEAVATDTFRNYTNGNYRLNTKSKGRDGGVYREWMATAKDVRGQPRKLGTAPDCGIYETGGGFTLIVR